MNLGLGFGVWGSGFGASGFWLDVWGFYSLEFRVNERLIEIELHQVGAKFLEGSGEHEVV